MWNTFFYSVGLITMIALLSGLLLSIANRRLPADANALTEAINDLLPQTQCAQCGYPGCRPYAAAIAANEAAINLCPPGGQETVDRLAELLGRDAPPLIETGHTVDSIAVVDEALCIGCTHCRAACPVDAILGAHQFMHTIIASECTGCELCIAPCPVDCIQMVRSS